MHLSKRYRGCRCIIRLILQLDVTLSAFSCFYIYLVKYFNWNEKFILLKNSSDRIRLELFIKTRIGLDNFRSDRILNIRQLSDYKRPIQFSQFSTVFPRAPVLGPP
jgi:hypothetical protein